MRLMTIVLVAVFGLAACGEAEMSEVPEVAEVEVEPLDGEMELDEELLIDATDIGSTLMATGWVAGVPLPNGFFLRTEGDRVIFVASEANVSAGDVVRVIGPLRASDVAVFEGWEAQAFESGYEAEWEVETTLFIDATMVMPMELQDSET